jgi:Tfp pilus assembly protein PilO
MNLIPKDKEKRKQLIIVIAVTLVLLGLIDFGLIRPQREDLAKIASTENNLQAKLQQIKNAVKKANETASQLAAATNNLSQAEADVASGDAYAWTYDTIRRFKASYRVDIPDIGQPSLGDVDVLPQFPYKQIKVNVSGTAYYHDLGKFIADFENTFPHIRMVNLVVDPANAGGSEAEKLSFRMDIIALVKSNP